MLTRNDPGGRLAAALVASASLHVAAIGFLGGLTPGAQQLPGVKADSLEIRLTELPSERAQLAGPPAISSLSRPPQTASPPVAIPTVSASAAASDAGRRESLPRGEAAASTASTGSVDVGPSPSIAVIGEALQGRAFTEFPVEIERPVQLLGAIDVPYPASALAANIEGTVYAWVIVNPRGSVDEVEIADGPPELAAAVQEALADARFRPAMDQGVPIRHYITLEIRFRIEPRPGPRVRAR
ncbi:MAG TPA: energy transducer TonB [Casimicrobiaceae bacterium]